jgi:hypothetical protein
MSPRTPGPDATRRRAAVAALGVTWALALAGIGAGAAACADLLNIEDRTAIADDSGTPATTPDVGATGPNTRDGEAAGDDGGPSANDASTGADATVEAAPPAAAFACLPDGAATDPCRLADGLDRPFKVVSDANRVYWVEYGDLQGGNGVVRSCAVSGCGGQPLTYATGQMEPKGVATDESFVYWTTTAAPPADGGAAPAGGIWKCPVSGCKGAPTLVAPATKPSDLFTDGVFLYWPDPSPNGPNTVSKSDLTTGATTVLYDGGGNLVPYDVAEVVVDSKNLYVEDFATNVFRVPLTGGNPVSFVAAPAPNSVPYALGIDSTNVYYGQGTKLLAMDKSTRSVTTIEDTLLQPVSVAVDQGEGLVYWTDFGSGSATADGKVGKAPVAGGGGTTLHAGLETPQSITVAGSYAYWVSAGTIVVSSNQASASVMANTGVLWRTAR